MLPLNSSPNVLSPFSFNATRKFYLLSKISRATGYLIYAMPRKIFHLPLRQPSEYPRRALWSLALLISLTPVLTLHAQSQASLSGFNRDNFRFERFAGWRRR